MKLLSTLSLIVGLCSFAFNASAQEIIGIQEQLDALKEEMIILQRKIYRDGVPAQQEPQAILPTSSKEQVKLGQYDEIIRTMNGKIDEMEYKIKQLENKIDTINKDMEVRFNLLEGKPIPAAQGAINTPRKFDTAVATGAPKAIVGDEVTTGKLTNLTPAKAIAGVDELYKEGLEALKAGKSAEAEQSFLLILDKFSNDKLAGNAQYWLGEVYYKDKNFAKAAVAFGKGYQNYKESTKGADSLLKLGLSMEQLNKKAEACAAFINLPQEFPKAETSIKNKAAAEVKKLGCK